MFYGFLRLRAPAGLVEVPGILLSFYGRSRRIVEICHVITRERSANWPNKVVLGLVNFRFAFHNRF